MNTPTNVKKIGLDPGFGAFKAAYVDRGTHEYCTAKLPAVVGAGTAGPDISISGLDRATPQPARPRQLIMKGQPYLVGHNVHKHARPIERLDFDRLGHGPDLEALTYAILWELLGPGKHQIELLVGLPVQIFNDADKRAETKANLAEWLLGGEHRYQVDGSWVDLDVLSVNVTAQPLGTFFHYGMDCKGNWIATDHPHAPIAVADLGFNTLDLFVVEGAQVSPLYSQGDSLGMRRAVKILKTDIQARYGATYSFHQCDNLIQNYLHRQETLVHHNEGTSDVAQMINHGLEASFGEVAAFLNDSWGDAGSFRRVLFTGGGANVFRNELLRLYPKAIVLTNPALANAIGLAKFSMRKRGE